jgi:2-phospho-L-lactate guanylyltransferase
VSAAVVPVKRLADSKSRLLPDLSRRELEALALAMAEDVLAALLATPEIERVAVATPDARVADAARELGAEALLGPDPGLNEAVEAAAAKLHLADDAPLLVVLGDVAAADPAELSQLFAELDTMPPGPAAVMAPSRDGGTCALLRRPHDAFPARFGRGSAPRHRDAARAAGVELRELDLRSLALDLDCADDVEQFVEEETGGPRTRALLGQLGWAPAHEGVPR